MLRNDSPRIKRETNPNIAWKFYILLVIRLSSIFIVQTYHVADEYYQSLEPAYKYYLGSSSLSSSNNDQSSSITRNKIKLTWEWRTDVALRSPLFLFFNLFSCLFHVDHWLDLIAHSTDYVGGSLVLANRLLYVLVAVFFEWKLYRFLKNDFKFHVTYFVKRLSDNCDSFDQRKVTIRSKYDTRFFRQKISDIYYYLMIFNWFWYYNCSRSLINSLELGFNCMGLIFYLESMDLLFDVRNFNKKFKNKYMNYQNLFESVNFEVTPENTALPGENSERRGIEIKKIVDKANKSRKNLYLRSDYINVKDFFQFYYKSPAHLIIVGVITAMRPTAVIPWVYLFLVKELSLLVSIAFDMEQIKTSLSYYHQFLEKNRDENDADEKNGETELVNKQETKVKKHISSYVIIIAHLFNATMFTAFILSSSFCADTLWYNRHTSTFWNFLKFNLLSGNSAIYGEKSQFWIFFDGIWTVYGLIPLFLMVLGNFVLVRLIESNPRRYENQNPPKRLRIFQKIIQIFEILKKCDNYGLFSACVFSWIIYSIPRHKEHRFILPILPFLAIFTASLYVILLCGGPNNLLLKNSRILKLLKIFPDFEKTYHLSKFIKFNILLNMTLAAYFSIIHQSGPHNITKFLRKSLKKSNQSWLLAWEDASDLIIEDLDQFRKIDHFYEFGTENPEFYHENQRHSWKFKNLKNLGLYAYDNKIIARKITRPITIWSLLPCHSLPAYSFYYDVDKEIELKQLECPPSQYRSKFFVGGQSNFRNHNNKNSDQPKSNFKYRELYNDGNQPIPKIDLLEEYNVAQNSNWIVIYQKDAMINIIWLHSHGFHQRRCFFHTHLPLGPEHDTHMCVYEKEILKLQQ